MKKIINKKQNKAALKSRTRSWGDLKKDKEQQKIYQENVSFIVDLHSKYGSS